MKMKNKFFVEITPELIKKAQERIDYILNEGCAHAGVSEKFDSNTKPEWYDEERFKKAQKIAHDYYVVVGNSSLIGLFLVLQLPIGLLPLLATGQSKNVSKLFSRYVNTIMHIRAWYNGDPFDPTSKAYKSQQMVKTMHQNAGKLMNSKISIYDLVKKMMDENSSKCENNNLFDLEKLIRRKDRTWVSQADKALTQWAFIGVLILEPYACGFHAGNKEKLMEIAYLWKVFGYKIGIEDRFNLFNELDFDLVYTICKLIFEQEYLPFVENASSPMGIRMSQGTMLGLRPVFKQIRWRSYINYWYQVLNINSYRLNNNNKLDSDTYDFVQHPIKTELTEEERALMLKNGYSLKYIVPNPQIPFETLELETFSDRFYCALFRFSVRTLFKARFYRNLVRKTSKGRINRALKNKAKHIEYMKKNFDKDYQYPACPFAGNILNKYCEYTDIIETAKPANI